MKKGLFILVCFTLTVGLLMAFAGTVAAQGPSHEGGLGEQRIMLNLANAETLGKAKGVTDQIAAAIVEYREKVGFFKKPEDLLKVPGITKEIYGKINPKVGAEGELYLVPKEGATIDEDEEVPVLAPSKC